MKKTTNEIYDSVLQKLEMKKQARSALISRVITVSLSLAITLLIAIPLSLGFVNNTKVDSSASANSSTAGGTQRPGRRPAGVNLLYSNHDGNSAFLQLELQSIGDMVTYSLNDGEYNYLFVDFKVLKDYSSKLQENAVITVPVSLAVNERPANIHELVEDYNSKYVSTLLANRDKVYGKKNAYAQDAAPSSAENVPPHTKENVNIDKEKVVNFLSENDSFIVYVHLLSGKTAQQSSTTDESKKYDSLTDILYFNNKNVYAVKDNAISQKPIVDICNEFGGLVRTNTYDNYDKFFYENIVFADFDNNIVEFLKKQANEKKN